MNTCFCDYGLLFLLQQWFEYHYPVLSKCSKNPLEKYGFFRQMISQIIRALRIWSSSFSWANKHQENLRSFKGEFQRFVRLYSRPTLAWLWWLLTSLSAPCACILLGRNHSIFCSFCDRTLVAAVLTQECAVLNLNNFGIIPHSLCSALARQCDLWREKNPGTYE